MAFPGIDIDPDPNAQEAGSNIKPERPENTYYNNPKRQDLHQ